MRWRILAAQSLLATRQHTSNPAAMIQNNFCTLCNVPSKQPRKHTDQMFEIEWSELLLVRNGVVF
jgi:hypothetical protein